MIMAEMAYCMKEKKKQPMVNVETVTMKTGRK
jgi:hypothetical protein